MARDRNRRLLSPIEEAEIWYRCQCDQIAWKRGILIVAQDGATYVETPDGLKLLCQPRKPKRIWYETWFALTYGELSEPSSTPDPRQPPPDP